MKRLSLMCCVLVFLSASCHAGAREVRFKKIVVDRTFRSEGVATGDVNHDGKTDIFAGDVWYAAPDWKTHELRRKERQPEFVLHEVDNDSGVGTQFEVSDFNGDKKPDIITSNKKGVHLFLQE